MSSLYVFLYSSFFSLLQLHFFKVFKALHLAYFQALSNPFLTLNTPPEALLDHASLLTASKMGSRGLARRVEAIGKAINTPKAQEQ